MRPGAWASHPFGLCQCVCIVKRTSLRLAASGLSTLAEGEGTAVSREGGPPSKLSSLMVDHARRKGIGTVTFNTGNPHFARPDQQCQVRPPHADRSHSAF